MSRLSQTEIETDQLLFTSVDDRGAMADDETPKIDPVLLVISNQDFYDTTIYLDNPGTETCLDFDLV